MTGAEPGGAGAAGGPDHAVTLRRSLGRRLRALRDESGKTYADVVHVGSRQKIMRIEKGEGPFKAPDIRELCRLYGTSAAETEELAGLALRTKEERIWDDYTDLLPGSFGTLVDLEVTANKICTYQPDVMPGLLQTPDYARAVFDASSPPLSREDVERMVLVRTQRQQGVFGGRAQARIHAVLNEAVLARRVGGPEVAAAQLKHVRDLNATDRVNIRVLTYDSGAHASMRGSFTLLEFADPSEPSVVYVESPAGARLIEKPAQFASHREVFTSLTEQSIPLEEYAP
jgi:transcriptional regulator with XRE-family HTH domain